MHRQQSRVQILARVGFVSALLLLLPPVGSAATYYVAKNGSDSNPGTKERPWLTIGQAASTMVAGDTVYVTAGTYNERVLPQNSGNSTSGYIGYVGWEEGVIIDGTGLGWNGIYANGKSYLRFERLQIANCHSDGIVIEYGDHIEIIDCTVEGNGKGNQSWDHGVELGRVTNFVIVNCDLVDNFSSGVSLYECEYGLVANCRAHDNNGDKAFGGYCDDSDGIAGNNCRHLIVENCEASYNGEDGIDFAMYKGFSGHKRGD